MLKLKTASNQSLSIDQFKASIPLLENVFLGHLLIEANGSKRQFGKANGIKTQALYISSSNADHPILQGSNFPPLGTDYSQMSCWLRAVGRCWSFDWGITFNSWMKLGGLLTKLYFLWWFFIVKLMKLWAPIDSILIDQLCIDKSIIFRTCQRNHEITNYVSMLQFAVEFSEVWLAFSLKYYYSLNISAGESCLSFIVS